MWVSISDHYEASTDGHIRNKKTLHVLKEFIAADGYLRTQFDGKTQTVHRVIAKAFIPLESGKDFVNHKDGNKTNNKVDNLEWCTRSENMKHAYTLGLKNSAGENNGRCKLTYEDVCFIREHYQRGRCANNVKSFAQKYHVTPQTISAVLCRQNWNQ